MQIGAYIYGGRELGGKGGDGTPLYITSPREFGFCHTN